MPKRITDAQILDASIEVLLAQGYTNATTRQIAEAAQISEMTLFRRFESKAKLVIAAVAHTVEQHPIDTTYTGNLEADLLTVLQGFQSKSDSRHALLFPLILSESARHPELKAAMVGPFSRLSKVATLMQRYQEEGQLLPEHPLHAVAALLAPLIILRMLRLSTPEEGIPPPDLQQHVQNFLHGRSLKPLSDS